MKLLPVRPSSRLLALVSAITAVTLVAAVWGFVSCAGGSERGQGSARSSTAAASGTASASGTDGSAPTLPLPPGVVGPGCGDYRAAVPTGPGSMATMAEEPVLTAVAGSPLLTTFASALTGRLNRRVDLSGELGRGRLTVFAPVDSAFALVPADRMATLRRQAPQLRTLLRGHIVAGALDASQVGGPHRTLAGTTVEVKGSGGSLTVDDVPVICGGLRTTNGVLYLLASVLPAR
ncbi:MAG: fasciclin domain-containing protein [Actinomycetales bacterium]